MGHISPGSRGSYFDCHDVDEIAHKYTLADWSEDGGFRLNIVNSEVEKSRVENEKLRDEMKKLGEMVVGQQNQVNLYFGYVERLGLTPSDRVEMLLKASRKAEKEEKRTTMIEDGERWYRERLKHEFEVDRRGKTEGET
jgi:hypothetical protein